MLIACYGFIPAGFPSPASDYQEDSIDINRHIIEHPTATFFFRAEGESMIGAHIPPNALLVVDRALKPKNGAIVVAVVDGEFTVKRLEKKMNSIRLLPENEKYRPIEITEGMSFEVWGVVRAIVIDKPE
ncbi:MAG: translesion error-prone DNA polymerase V autoproteolytic subunit [Chitinophagaceae bacterium]|nr:translesion error-prone DNA polymerase V autoproteolytic subunit [Flavisolibacter longurius]RYY46499.1 MAG: translesion error-prone DNA polymerase V autoproteolytic subunit [Chitinophagaceae bacterium]